MAAKYYPWQQAQWQQFIKLDEIQRLPHGLLLAGPGETGKFDFALLMAKYLLCQAPVVDGPCGTCKTCKLFDAQSHPDFCLIEPEEKGKVIKIDQIRQLSEFTGKTAGMGGRRVVLVQPAEAMNLNAANAFLKTLEEPGVGVCLILVSHEPTRLLATIRSRCRLFPFALPLYSDTRSWLQNQVDAGSQLDDVIAMSGGRPLRAMRLLNTELREQWALFQETLGAVESNHVPVSDAARTLQALPKNDTIEWFQYRVYSFIKGAAEEGRSAPTLLFRFLDRLNDARRRLTSTANLNVLLVWEEVLMDWRSVVDLASKR